jgi:hypothetical protein
MPICQTSSQIREKMRGLTGRVTVLDSAEEGGSERCSWCCGSGRCCGREVGDAGIMAWSVIYQLIKHDYMIRKSGQQASGISSNWIHSASFPQFFGAIPHPCLPDPHFGSFPAA